MSRENVEVVRRCFKAFALGNVAAFLEQLDEAVDWQPTSSVVSADPEVKNRCYPGVEGVREWFEDSRRSGVYDVTPQTFHADEDWVLLEASAMLGDSWMQASRGPIYFVFRVQHGKVVSLRTYISKITAFEAVGLQQ